jgi:hypothetical protein
MFPSHRWPFVVFVILLVASAAGAADPMVHTISATAGKPTTFVVTLKDSSKVVKAVSSSLLIEDVLLPALLSGAKVEVEVVPDTHEIKRVDPFAPGKGPVPGMFDGEYLVSRIATQRKDDGTGEHLEAFVKKVGSKEEKAYNVYDPSLQHVLIAALQPENNKDVRVDLKFDGEEIVTVTLGQKLIAKGE